MKKTINIITILTVLVAVLDTSMGLLSDLGLNETAQNWVKFIGLVAVAVLNVIKPKPEIVEETKITHTKSED